MAFQDLAEALFINQRIVVSTVNATSLNLGPVPRKKLWTFQCASYFPDTAETRTVQWCIVNPAGTTLFAVSVPVSIALSPVLLFPLVTEGLDFTLLPGQYLQVRRDVATAGSTMTVAGLFVESDMPLYHYEEPLQRLRMRKSAVESLSRGPGTRATGLIPGPAPIRGPVGPREK